ncbi:MAG: GTPase HflX [Candidatus Methylomirabilales bacterium]|nr:GTPase HflX [candidate division NC10 bacterium]MCZ6551891.1 GTPase HflX [candidate division NC10 bacterium]
MSYPQREVALLVGFKQPHQARWEVEDSLEELVQLTVSAGAEPAFRVVQERSLPNPRTLIGPGKAQEVREACQEGVDLVIFDNDLTGSQQRNLEVAFGRKVIDRTGLILDIFAQRARSKEGKLQVELAQLKYLLPRLTGHGTDLSRLGGGIGTRGPGETQLEVDRRRIRRRILKIEQELEKVRRHRALLRRHRQKQALSTAALVGYTNAGKSSLLNALTHAELPVADKLFATLDPTLRKVILPGGRAVLLSDTVGFIRKLPHQLVAAFKASLEEVQESDLLVHVIDISHPRWQSQEQGVIAVLEELGVAAKPLINVYNKVDKLPHLEAVAFLSRRPRSVVTSAKTGAGLTELKTAIAETLNSLEEATVRRRAGRGK